MWNEAREGEDGATRGRGWTLPRAVGSAAGVVVLAWTAVAAAPPAPRAGPSSPDLVRAGRELTTLRRPAPDGRHAGRRRAGTDTVPTPRRSLFEGGRRAKAPPMAGFAAEQRPPLRPISRADAFGSPFLAAPSELGDRGRVLGLVTAGSRPLRAWHARVGDRVRVRLQGIRATEGDTLYAVRTGRSVDGRRRVTRPLALLTVESAGEETAVARVAEVFGLVRPGESVVRIPVPPAPDAVEFLPARREIDARMLGLVEGTDLLRDGTLVFLGAGASDGVRPGDVFVAGAAEDAAPGEGGGGQDTRVIVVRVLGETSTARVIDAGDGSVGVGARARLARRLAGPGR